MDEQYVFRSNASLHRFSEDIKNGRSFVFDVAEIERILKLGREVDNIDRVGLFRAAIQMLLPISIVMIGAAYMIFFR